MSCTLGYPEKFANILQTEIIGNNLWLKAKEVTSSTRVILLADPVGRVILQIRADHSQHFNQPIVIQADLAVQKSVEDSHSFSYGYVTLTRWVVQQLYAPPRLLRELTGVQRLAVDATPIEIFSLCHADSNTVCRCARCHANCKLAISATFRYRCQNHQQPIAANSFGSPRIARSVAKRCICSQ